MAEQFLEGEMSKTAIIVVDMLYDFIDGSLACCHAQEAVKAAKSAIERSVVDEPDYPVLFILDHHPSNHSSFKEFGGIWPAHCVMNTRGGEIHDDLKPFVRDDLCFYKGCEVTKEQYSGFEGVSDKGQSLNSCLQALGVKSVIVVGIATEYCVKATCMDLLINGFEVSVIADALAYVDIDGHLKTLEEFEKSGIIVQKKQ